MLFVSLLFMVTSAFATDPDCEGLVIMAAERFRAPHARPAPETSSLVAFARAPFADLAAVTSPRQLTSQDVLNDPSFRDTHPHLVSYLTHLKKPSPRIESLRKSKGERAAIVITRTELKALMARGLLKLGSSSEPRDVRFVRSADDLPREREGQVILIMNIDIMAWGGIKEKPGALSPRVMAAYAMELPIWSLEKIVTTPGEYREILGEAETALGHVAHILVMDEWRTSATGSSNRPLVIRQNLNPLHMFALNDPPSEASLVNRNLAEELEELWFDDRVHKQIEFWLPFAKSTLTFTTQMGDVLRGRLINVRAEGIYGESELALYSQEQDKIHYVKANDIARVEVTHYVPNGREQGRLSLSHDALGTKAFADLVNGLDRPTSPHRVLILHR